MMDPEKKLMKKQVKQSTGSYSVTAEKNGRYEYCFSNQMSAVSDKTVRCVILVRVSKTYVFN